MTAKFLSKPPPVLLALVTVAGLAVLLSRETSVMEVLPVFLPQEKRIIHVEVVADGTGPAVYQLIDGSTLCDVIKLTELSGNENLTSISSCDQRLSDGQSLQIPTSGEVGELPESVWMSAGKRMALSIPLHPDRMTRQDWTALPGIGEKLAETIDLDRQKNGDFGSFERLIRVKGIGRKKLERWRMFFSES